MLVYGDHSDRVSPQACLTRIRDALAGISCMPSGVERHSALVSALIATGRLQQGLADADFALDVADRRTPNVDAVALLAHGIAKNVVRSWQTGGREIDQLPDVPEALELAGELDLKLPEGFAFYAVYPEAFATAALRLELRAPPRVIAIRSIGTTLGAMVAAALDASPAVSVRPFGHPFDRRIEIDPALEAQLLAEPAHFIIVDEGPGLSGSSFGAVADWLEGRGVPTDRIAFMPSHSGSPGAEAPVRHRERWPNVQRVAADFGPGLGELVGQWSSDLLGPIDAEPVELSGGEWRRLRFTDDEADWPACNPMWERRKFLLEANGEEWIARFAGLGEEGQRKLHIARQLHEAGFAPEPRGLVQGFLVERWHGEGRPLGQSEQPVEEIADYLATRALMLPVPRPGASLAELLRMARRNAGLALGAWAEQALDAWSARVDSLQRRVVPVCTDGRLDRHEWLRLPNGHLLKTDGLDHHAAHDLVGCQDLAWDVAGASIEFALDPDQTHWLAAEAGRRAKRPVDSELLHFLTLAYLAFRLGQARLSADSAAGADIQRWQARADELATQLKRALDPQRIPATRQRSLIG